MHYMGPSFCVRGCDMARGEAEGHITSEDPKRGPIYTAYIPTSMLYNIYFLHVTSFQLPVAPIKKFPFRLNVTLAQNRCWTYGVYAHNERLKDGWETNDECTENRLWTHKEPTMNAYKKDDERTQHVATTNEH